jgi:ADP-heptose:LPS heptosyltransferase
MPLLGGERAKGVGVEVRDPTDLESCRGLGGGSESGLSVAGQALQDWMVKTPTDLSRPGFLAIADRGIGDALTLLPSLHALRAAHPTLRIELLTPGLLPLADNLRDIGLVLDHRPLEGLGDDGQLAWLRGRNVEWVWNTEGERGPWTAALRRSDNPRWVTAPAQREWGSKNVLRVRFAQLQELFPELRAPGELGITLTPSQSEAREAFRAGFGHDSLLVAIQPGAGDRRRIWPAEKYRELACTLVERPRVSVLFFLSEAESFFRAPGYLPEDANFHLVSGRLDDVVPKLAACDLYIGNDSGFYHLAFALGLRVVGIHRSLRGAQRWAYRSPWSRVVINWVPRQLERDWTRWVSVSRVLRAARRLTPGL